jgi:hypothetical protein
MHSVILLGGPVPKYGGDLRTIQYVVSYSSLRTAITTLYSVSYGRNRTAAQSHFPQWDKPRFNSVLALMKEYLDTVFSMSTFAIFLIGD